MLDALKSLPEDPAELRAVSERLMAEVRSLTYQNEKLKAELHGHRKTRFGSKSESLDQLSLDLAEDAEIAVGAEAQKSEPAEADSKPPKRQHSRKPLPDHLERQDEVLSAGGECDECGGSLRQIDEDITEELEYIPGRFAPLDADRLGGAQHGTAGAIGRSYRQTGQGRPGALCG